jgi:uncharacterized repeat protein (TIGR02543 family)
MKKIFKGLLLSFLLISSASLTSCFGFGEEALQINTITTVTLENGDIQVIITYTDEDVKPTTFVVPKGTAGEDGKDGNGIKEITYSQSEDKQNTIVNIAFTQQGVNPVDVIVPNGVSVTSIDQSFDEETQMTTLIVNFSDGTKSEPILIPKGEKGEDGINGVGILAVEYITNEDLSTTLTIKMTNEESYYVTIPAPIKGEDGRGIKDIVSIPNGDTYVMTITFTDDTTQELEFARPNRWFSELAKPTVEDGIDGDLWYDIQRQIIYIKQGGRWIEVMNFNDVVDDTCEVKFYLNDSEEYPADMPAGSLISYEIEKGSYFSATGYSLPIPTREGYEFAGWYTVKVPTVVNGTFTDLTPVVSDLSLYASWIETTN